MLKKKQQKIYMHEMNFDCFSHTFVKSEYEKEK